MSSSISNIVAKMKLLPIFFLAIVAAQSASIPALQDRIVLYQHALPAKLRNEVQVLDSIKWDSRIVGGTEVPPHSQPHQCALVIDSLYFCGCSIIDRKNVLTAAHCVDKGKFFDITFGDHDLTVDEGTEVAQRSTFATLHDEWDSDSLDHDIAIIHLGAPLIFDVNIRSIPMANTSAPDYDGVMLNATGWGKDSDSASGISDVLREVSAPGLAKKACADAYGTNPNGHILCIDTTGGKGSCNGDSGGPLTVVENGIQIQVGVISFGAAVGCEAGYPTGSTRISSYRDWIDDNIIA